MSEKAHTLRGHVGGDPDEKIIDAARRLVIKAMRRGLTTENLTEMVESTIFLAEGIIATVRQVHGPPKHKACQMGCNYCCYLEVEVSVPEVLRLVSFIRQKFSREQADSLAKRLRMAAGVVQKMNDFERLFAKLPCPLLKDGNCSVYEARPLVCRGYNSYNWVPCAHELKHPRSSTTVPHDEAQRDTHSDVLDGLIAGLKEGELYSEPLELIAALHIALDEPDLAERWLAGEAVLESAVASKD
jgi:Fe-S-cluster containining protein